MKKENFSQENFDARHFENQTFAGGGEPVPNDTGCAGVVYAARVNIEAIYGQDNVAKWADVNNNGDLADSETRICWALLSAQTYIDERLLGGPYSIPFASPYPQSVTDNTARLAGVILYEARGVTDTGGSIGGGRTKSYSMPKHQLSYHRSMVERWLNDLLSMQSRLVGLDIGTTYPIVASESE